MEAGKRASRRSDVRDPRWASGGHGGILLFSLAMPESR